MTDTPGVVEHLEVSAQPCLLEIIEPPGAVFPGSETRSALEAMAGYANPPARFLAEWVTYRVVAPGADSLKVGSITIPPLISGHGEFALRFENQLGIADIQPYRGGRPIGPALRVEVIAAKFATPLESIRFMDLLLVDLFARRAPLPFQVAAPTGRLVREARRAPNLLFAWHFFRQHGHALVRAVQAIMHRPLRRLFDEREDVLVAEASSIDLEAMLSVVQRATRNDRDESRMAHRLRPTSVEQRRSVETLDIPENRFVLDVVRRMVRTANAVLRQPWIARASEADQGRLVATRDALLAFARDRQFNGVGESMRVPTESRALQRRDGYRELTRLWFAFQQARQPQFDRLQQAIDVRDIATLYEYWVFFELMEQVALAVSEDAVLGSVGPDGLARDLTCTFGSVGKLHYNSTRKGYSGVWLRPDFLWVPTGGQPLAFDAKFRMVARPDSGDDGDAPPSDIAAGMAYDPKDDDLVKMHAYRDALGVRAAVVLYPGTRKQFRPASGNTHEVSVGEMIMNASLSGVGEIVMSPLATGEAR